jgi:uncharacterized RDD family membrane protein YckC
MFGQTRNAFEIAADARDLARWGELRYAGFWARAAALIADIAIVTLFGLVLIVGASIAGDAMALVAMLVCLLVALLYWPLLECSALQATFGKQLLGIQVTDMEGGRLSFVRSLLRNLAKIVSLLPLCLGFLPAGFTARKQALHDMIVSCLVVRSGPSHLFRAVAAFVVGLILISGGLFYFVENDFLPQAISHIEKQMSGLGASLQDGMDKAMKGAQQGAPAPAPQPAGATPPASQPAPPVAAATPEAPPAAAPAPKEAVPAPPAAASAPAKPAAAPGKPASAEVKPAPPKPAAAAKAVAASPAKQAVPAVTPILAPSLSAELVSEPPADKPQRARRIATPRPAAEAPAPVPAAPLPAAKVPAPVPAAPPRRVVTPKYNDVMTAVMYRDAAAITQLLDLGWWVDRRDTNGVTPLMAAAWNGDTELVQLLLQRGADPNRRARGGSVLDYAGRSGDGLIIEMLKDAGAR